MTKILEKLKPYIILIGGLLSSVYVWLSAKERPNTDSVHREGKVGILWGFGLLI